MNKNNANTAPVEAVAPFTFPALFYMVVFVVVIIIGAFFAKKREVD